MAAIEKSSQFGCRRYGAKRLPRFLGGTVAPFDDDGGDAVLRGAEHVVITVADHENVGGSAVGCEDGSDPE